MIDVIKILNEEDPFRREIFALGWDEIIEKINPDRKIFLRCKSP